MTDPSQPEREVRLLRARVPNSVVGATSPSCMRTSLTAVVDSAIALHSVPTNEIQCLT